VDILIPYGIARNIIANRYPARDNPLGSCGSLGSYRVPGTWRTQYYIRIPDNAQIVGTSPLNGGYVLAGPVAPGPWPDAPT
jgi:hypothetical protein